ncbi:hypothetical protein KY312_04070 [Candidatus Woesearchaeota archaeon]|nr:hypothetical protein [Candidatus Woesearchaeota archaeon]
MNKKLTAIVSALALGLGSFLWYSKNEPVVEYEVPKPMIEEQTKKPDIVKKPELETIEKPKQDLSEKLVPVELPEVSVEEQLAVLANLNIDKKNYRQDKEGNVVYLQVQRQNLGESVDVSKLQYLKHLCLFGNELKRVDGLENLRDLEKAMIYNNKLEQITGLQHLKKLKQLHLNVNCLEEIDVSGMDNVEVLILAFNRLEKVKGLETLGNLRKLYIHGNKNLKWIGDLSELKHLHRVYVLGNPIQDLNNLKKLYEKGIEVKSDYSYEELKNIEVEVF